MPQESLEEASGSLKQWVAAARSWGLSERPALKAARSADAERQKGKHNPSRMTLRLEEGRRFEEWRKGEGANSKAQLRDYLRQRWTGYEHIVPKKDRVWLAGCHKAFLAYREQASSDGASISLVGMLPKQEAG